MNFTAIKNDNFSVLSMDELRSMKITEKNVLEVKLSCGCDINSHDKLNICSTVKCVFKLCSKKSYHHYMDQSNYCANCKKKQPFVRFLFNKYMNVR